MPESKSRKIFSNLKPVYFPSGAGFRTWLEKHHRTAKEVWVKYYKKSTGKPSMDWSGSVDVALCFGWIDGIRKSIDAESFTSRFTPRRPGSNWSEVNIRKVRELEKKGLMTDAGREAFNKRKPASSDKGATDGAEKRLRTALARSASARQWFSAQPPGYRKNIIAWIAVAKRAETRKSRIAKLVEACRKKERISW